MFAVVLIVSQKIYDWLMVSQSDLVKSCFHANIDMAKLESWANKLLLRAAIWKMNGENFFVLSGHGSALLLGYLCYMVRSSVRLTLLLKLQVMNICNFWFKTWNSWK